MQLLLCAASLLIASVALAEVVVTEADKDAMIKGIKARGCVITDKNDARLLGEVGLPQPVAYAAVAALIAEARAEIVDDHLHLKTGSCK